MKKYPIKKVTSDNNLIPEELLGDWLAATDALSRNYEQLSQYINTNTEQQANHLIGQCSRDQLITVLNRLSAKLAELLLEINQLNQQDTRTKAELLIAHTQKLDELNHHAQTLLHLATLRAS